jgi:hypothetical protein
MKTEQKKWSNEGGWQNVSKAEFQQAPQLVLVFGGSGVIKEGKYFEEVKKFYPDSNIISGTTAGEILNNEVNDNSLSLKPALLLKKLILKIALKASQSVSV